MGFDDGTKMAEEKPRMPLEQAVMELEDVAKNALRVAEMAYDRINVMLGARPAVEGDPKQEQQPDCQLDRVTVATGKIRQCLNAIESELDRL